MSKIAIIGAGSVGATLAYNLSIKGVVSEIALIDIDTEKAEAEVLDILHGMSLGRPVDVHPSDYGGCADASIVVVTAGAKQKPSETRVELLGRNAGLTRDISRAVLASGFAGIFLVISNPVDVLTYIVHREASGSKGFPASRVIGSGTVLDSSRLREFLGERCGVNPMNIHGYVLGEHGDTSFPAWSLTSIGGAPLAGFCAACSRACDTEALYKEAEEYVRGSADRIIQAKGATYYGIAQAASVIIQAVVRNERRILPVSTVRSEFRGIGRTAFSFPTIVGAGGAEQVLDLPLSEEDEVKLMKSARFVSSLIEGMQGS